MTLFLVILLALFLFIFMGPSECFKGSSYDTEIEFSPATALRKPEFVEPRNFIF